MKKTEKKKEFCFLLIEFKKKFLRQKKIIENMKEMSVNTYRYPIISRLYYRFYS